MIRNLLVWHSMAGQWVGAASRRIGSFSCLAIAAIAFFLAVPCRPANAQVEVAPASDATTPNPLESSQEGREDPVSNGTRHSVAAPKSAEPTGTREQPEAESTDDSAVEISVQDELPVITLEEVQKELDALTANSSIEDPVKALCRPIYKEAIDALKRAATNKLRASEYRASLQTAPQQTLELREQMQALPSVDEAIQLDASGDVAELDQDLAARKSQLSSLRVELEKATSILTRIQGRAGEVILRMPKIKPELATVRASLESPENASDTSSPRRVAERLLLKAREAELLTEQEMLKEEKASQFVRDELAKVRQQVLTRQVENENAIYDALDARRLQDLRNESSQIASTIERAKANLPIDDQAVTQLVEEVEALAAEFGKVVDQTKQVSNAQKNALYRLSKLEREYERLQSELKLEGAGGGMAQVLFDLQERLFNPTAYAIDATAGIPKVDETRVQDLKVQRGISGQDKLVKEFSRYNSESLNQLLDERLQLLTKLREQFSRLIPALIELNAKNGEFMDRVSHVRTFIDQQLFWIRSSPPVTAGTIAAIPSGFRWLLSAEHWKEFVACIITLVDRKPVRCLLLLVAFVVLCLLRPWFISALVQTGVATRRISTDRYSVTWQALGLTFLLTLPIPMLLFFFSWAIQESAGQNAWLRGLASGLQDGVWVMFFLQFLTVVCRPDGLGVAHFGGQPASIRLVRKVSFRFGLIYVPANLLVASTLYGDASQYSDSVGRFFFIVAHVCVAGLLWRLFGSRYGLLVALERRFPDSPIPKLRYLCMGLVLACPLALITLAWRGYVITAIEISLGIIATFGVISAVDIAYLMVLRWFALKHRKLALAERLESRRARQESAAEEETVAVAEEVIDVNQEVDEELDLDSISEQTHRLLRFSFTLASFVLVVAFWSGTIPLISVLETIQVPIFGSLNLLEVCQSVMIIAMTVIAVKNLPGLLELSVLRTTDFEAGTRYAIVTLCRYAMMAIGFLALAGVLDVDWSKFGWIAAALSVGIGFGMQEVVTNFVCGIILLFERPVRIGDVVTVEGTTGTVTRIRMRATTITNWDRQEFVVPNKNLITNTILNWTLTATTSRIVITVGAAYGTDTDRARQILVEIAQDHPVVLEDPQPIATFEEFADSSLTLCLRAYVPDLGSRLTTITELHSEIDKRYAAEGIEIAFPQQDLHLRSGFRCGECGGVGTVSALSENS